NKEAIVSRGELIEIGGSFRIPDIMAASDCKMVEVGATNKTKSQDYENAITENTALLFKAHQSNYVIKGFTQEVELPELVSIGKKHSIPVVYDIGSGLLRKVNERALKNEPDVKQALASGIDLICFSGDKLLGGPQAGIIAGKKKYIDILKNEPMMRALRVGKTTLAILETACSYYLNDKDLFENNVLFKTLNKSKEEIKETAEKLKTALDSLDICSKIVDSKGKYGGGTLPDLELDSFSVKLLPKDANNQLAKKLYHELLEQKQPILSNLKSGAIYFDALTLENREIDVIAQTIKTAFDDVYGF
ncbi:MAG: L-seryl-tRNA(Sec) selenium transferase, partial [Bacteroidales bacterium]|nr:L-seryl-tRNA(Sec) selenium transferase [Bacteroidales bacterium]